MRITIDRDLCLGASACERAAPELFTLDDKNIAMVHAPHLLEALRDKAIDAVESCPSGALAIEED